MSGNSTHNSSAFTGLKGLGLHDALVKALTPFQSVTASSVASFGININSTASTASSAAAVSAATPPAATAAAAATATVAETASNTSNNSSATSAANIFFSSLHQRVLSLTCYDFYDVLIDSRSATGNSAIGTAASVWTSSSSPSSASAGGVYASKAALQDRLLLLCYYGLHCLLNSRAALVENRRDHIRKVAADLGLSLTHPNTHNIIHKNIMSCMPFIHIPEVTLIIAQSAEHAVLIQKTLLSRMPPASVAALAGANNYTNSNNGNSTSLASLLGVEVVLVADCDQPPMRTLQKQYQLNKETIKSRSSHLSTASSLAAAAGLAGATTATSATTAAAASAAGGKNSDSTSESTDDNASSNSRSAASAGGGGASARVEVMNKGFPTNGFVWVTTMASVVKWNLNNICYSGWHKDNSGGNDNNTSTGGSFIPPSVSGSAGGSGSAGNNNSLPFMLEKGDLPLLHFSSVIVEDIYTSLYGQTTAPAAPVSPGAKDGRSKAFRDLMKAIRESAAHYDHFFSNPLFNSKGGGKNVSSEVAATLSSKDTTPNTHVMPHVMLLLLGPLISLPVADRAVLSRYYRRYYPLLPLSYVPSVAASLITQNTYPHLDAILQRQTGGGGQVHASGGGGGGGAMHPSLLLPAQFSVRSVYVMGVDEKDRLAQLRETLARYQAGLTESSTGRVLLLAFNSEIKALGNAVTDWGIFAGGGVFTSLESDNADRQEAAYSNFMNSSGKPVLLIARAAYTAVDLMDVDMVINFQPPLKSLPARQWKAFLSVLHSTLDGELEMVRSLHSNPNNTAENISNKMRQLHSGCACPYPPPHSLRNNNSSVTGSNADDAGAGAGSAAVREPVSIITFSLPADVGLIGQLLAQYVYSGGCGQLCEGFMSPSGGNLFSPLSSVTCDAGQHAVVPNALLFSSSAFAPLPLLNIDARHPLFEPLVLGREGGRSLPRSGSTIGIENPATVKKVLEEKLKKERESQERLVASSPLYRKNPALLHGAMPYLLPGFVGSSGGSGGGNAAAANGGGAGNAAGTTAALAANAGGGGGATGGGGTAAAASNPPVKTAASILAAAAAAVASKNSPAPAPVVTATTAVAAAAAANPPVDGGNAGNAAAEKDKRKKKKDFFKNKKEKAKELKAEAKVSGGDTSSGSNAASSLAAMGINVRRQ